MLVKWYHGIAQQRIELNYRNFSVKSQIMLLLCYYIERSTEEDGKLSLFILFILMIHYYIKRYSHKTLQRFVSHYLTIRLRARDFYEVIVSQKLRASNVIVLVKTNLFLQNYFKKRGIPLKALFSPPLCLTQWCWYMDNTVLMIELSRSIIEFSGSMIQFQD